MKTLKDVVVGQQIFLVEDYSRNKGEYREVIKVGRSLIHCYGNVKIDINSGMQTNKYCGGKITAYYSEEAYDDWLAKCTQKKLLIGSIESLIRGCDIEQLKSIVKLIKGE